MNRNAYKKLTKYSYYQKKKLLVKFLKDHEINY